MLLLGAKIETTHANFGRMLRDRCLLVDKTLFIKAFFEGHLVSLILRPRRFGKTLTMSMLQHFFAKTVTGLPTAELFRSSAIAQVDEGGFLAAHQGQYPVISVTFKDLKALSYESMIRKFSVLMQSLYQEHHDQLMSDKVSESEKARFLQYLNGSAPPETLQDALVFLSYFLAKTYTKNVIVLLDEYDSPLTAAYSHQYLEPLSLFMRNLLSSVFKDNAYLEKGLLTGILRVSKNQMLSELNNLEVYTVLNEPFNTYFGFTDNEVTELIQHTQADHRIEDMRPFYNGYLIGGEVIYNPWSVMHYLDKRKLSCYWVQTSNDALLKEVLVSSRDETKEQMSRLMQGDIIEGNIDLTLRYEDLFNKKEAIWTLLLFAGYLTAASTIEEGMEFRCQLKIPNQEVQEQYVSIFKHYLQEQLGETNYNTFIKSLLAGNVDDFTTSLGHYLMDALSYHDVAGKKAEKFYHGFVAGLVASVRQTHWVDSNKEGGHGRYDLLLTPKNLQHSLGIIIEFKKTNHVDALSNLAEEALNQININHYDAVLKRFSHIHHVLKVGLAFCNKAVISAYQQENLNTHEKTKLIFSRLVDDMDENDW